MSQIKPDIHLRRSLIARLFGAKDIRLHFQDESLLLVSGRGEALELQIELLGEREQLRNGIFSAKLTLPTTSGDKSLSWLQKGSAQSAQSRLIALWYQSMATEVAKAASEARVILNLGYLRNSRLEKLRQIAFSQVTRFKDVPPQGIMAQEERAKFTLLHEIHHWSEDDIERKRDAYVERMEHQYGDYFETIESNPLTDSQRRGCIIDQDNNLVLAGAGTGKTSTMIGRAGFLVKSRQALPNQILMLAFARKAADEMQDRLDERIGERGIVASTFHKLGKDIIAAVEGAQPSVSALAEDDKLLASKVSSWFDQKMIEPEYKKKVLEYFQYYLYPQVNPFDFETEGEYFDYILANDIRTLKGEAVKGLGECLVANHLFKLGIEYQYEAPYEHSTRSLDFRQYQPDFYLPEHGIYIEHVGIDREGETAPYVDRAKYHAGMEWKRKLHQDNQTTLIETYHYEMQDGSLFAALEEKLTAAGVDFKPLPPDAVLETLREFGAVTAFAELLAQLLRRYKACHFSEEQVSKVVSNSDNPGQVSAALELLTPILEFYESELAGSEQIDFDDMIGKAIDYVTEGRFKSSWRYILVDEFQDISDPRARLIKALRNSVDDCSLFCVGDDWQAIYRFTGSDLQFTTDFEPKFGATKITALDKTFRFNNSISDVASKFVLKNPSQIEKALNTHLKVKKPAVSLLRQSTDLADRQNNEIDKRLFSVLDSIEKIAEGPKSVFLLGRFGFNLPDYRAVKSLNQRYPSLDISTLTMHASKGKEADYVVLLGLESGKHGFPSQKVTHPLLEALLPKQEPYNFAEERRLFYVAVTRARHRAYLISDMANASEFVVELVKDDYPIELGEFETSLAQELFQAIRCKKCETGTMVPRQGKHGPFYGCSHFPLCNNAENGCKSCGNPMQRLGRFKVCIDPECESWVPTCPKCGAEMAQRKGKYGQFWGCRNYRGDEDVSCSYTENEISYHHSPAIGNKTYT